MSSNTIRTRYNSQFLHGHFNYFNALQPVNAYVTRWEINTFCQVFYIWYIYIHVVKSAFVPPSDTFKDPVFESKPSCKYILTCVVKFALVPHQNVFAFLLPSSLAEKAGHIVPRDQSSAHKLNINMKTNPCMQQMTYNEWFGTDVRVWCSQDISSLANENTNDGFVSLVFVFAVDQSNGLLRHHAYTYD